MKARARGGTRRSSMDPTRPPAARRANAQPWDLAAESKEWGGRKRRHVPNLTRLYEYAKQDEKRGTKKAQTKRARELQSARASCDLERADVDQTSKAAAADERRAATLRGQQKRRLVREGCAVRRGAIRATARGEIAGLRSKSKEARESAFGPARSKYDKRKRQTAKEKREESDSQAEHSIPKNLIGWWRKNRRLYPYDLPHDERAARFLEDAEGQWDEIQAASAAKWEHFDYAAAEAEAAAEAVPF